MDWFDDDTLLLRFTSRLGRAKSAKRMGYVLENEMFWKELMRVDRVSSNLKPVGQDETFVQVSATNPVTGEKVDLPPARLKSMFFKKKQ